MIEKEIKFLKESLDKKNEKYKIYFKGNPKLEYAVKKILKEIEKKGEKNDF